MPGEHPPPRSPADVQARFDALQRRRFTVAALGGSARPLSAKLLERIRALIPDATRAHMVPYNTTELERDVALRLGIPMYGADPRYFPLGTKSGGRRLLDAEAADAMAERPLPEGGA